MRGLELHASSAQPTTSQPILHDSPLPQPSSSDVRSAKPHGMISHISEPGTAAWRSHQGRPLESRSTPIEHKNGFNPIEQELRYSAEETQDMGVH